MKALYLDVDFFQDYGRFRTLFLALLLQLPLTVPGFASDFELLIGDQSYQIDLAATAQQRQLGLMYRASLGPKQGMLLVYPGMGDRRIWMKNVLIPLQVFWIDDDFHVIHRQRLEPCSDAPCPVYAAQGKARYVLELGDYEHRLRVGDRIDGLSEVAAAVNDGA